MKAPANITSKINGVVDFILPPRCTACDIKVSDTGALCPSCWSDLALISPPHCACCGLPFSFDEGKDALCAACIKDTPPYIWARAALRYDDTSQSIILALKHGKRLENAALMARMCQLVANRLLDDIDTIIPVPLHRRRLFKRRFNQSAYLAQHLNKLNNIPVDVMSLTRVKATPPQVGLSRSERQKNVRGAFKVLNNNKIKGKRLLLIDDVFTTGATVEACAKVLVKAGAENVAILTFARTFKAK